ncbi:MAG: Nramp family divalent metal transporter [Pirellulaceae bacterium]|nr:Nramp family divalent metal transporter [Pirellulaceae bacterium]
MKDAGTKFEHRHWYQRIGPGLITACVVIGPGSVMTSSTVGAKYGMQMLWVVVAAAGLMMLFMSLGAKLGAVAQATPAELIRRQAGRPLAVFVGLAVLLTAALFQSGNNIGVAAAFEGFVQSKTIVAGLLVVFNALAIAFLFAFKHMYRMLERVMTTFVALMLVSFAINLIWLRPDPWAMASGLVPSLAHIDFASNLLPLLGLVGTTFVVTAAYYQAYLVRQKGWQVQDLSSGLLDARISALVLSLITIMLMTTAAVAFHQQSQSDPTFKLTSPAAIGLGLQATFGEASRVIFCVGLFSAAYSSFLINSMIGGFMAADGLGWDIADNARGAKLLTTAVLLMGLVVGMAVVLLRFDRTPMIIVAQAVTVVIAPLVAIILVWLTASRTVMGRYANGWATNVVSVFGCIVLLAMAYKTAAIDLPALIFRAQ